MVLGSDIGHEGVHFTRRLLIYVPTYNCSDTIVDVLRSIPPPVQMLADLLVVDNCSEDGTAQVILEARRKGTIRADTIVVQPARNVGYAGSQKLAYSLACQSAAVEWVAMLHGDGQYPPQLLDKFAARLESTAGIVYGHRSKLMYPLREETPITTWLIIRSLSLLESLLTGVFRIEWHSGFAMLATRFLRRLNLSALTSTPHIDGHLLFAAHALGESVETIPIYKLYKSLSPFDGLARRQYVYDVLRMMKSMRSRSAELAVLTPVAHDPRHHAQGAFTVLE